MHLKAAARQMLPELQKKFGNDINVVRIDNNIIPLLPDIIFTLLGDLIHAKLIDNISPQFNIGSTRLIADKLRGDLHLHEPYEDMKIYHKALKCKDNYGDIDVDISTDIPIDQIGKFLKSVYPNIAVRQCGTNEINIGYLIEDIKSIVQIDLINIKDKFDNINYNQFSSFIDIANGLKGLVRDALATSITKTTPIDIETKNIIQTIVKNHSNIMKELCSVDPCDTIICDDIRWSLGHDRLKLIVSFLKVKNGKHLKTLCNIVIDDIQRIIPGYETLQTTIPYDRMDHIAQKIGLSASGIMYHSILMLREIKHFNLKRKQDIWNSFIKTLKRKRPTETAGGQLSHEEADQTIEIIKPYFEGINYDSCKNA